LNAIYAAATNGKGEEKRRIKKKKMKRRMGEAAPNTQICKNVS
jgi:hypothetical protein